MRHMRIAPLIGLALLWASASAAQAAGPAGDLKAGRTLYMSYGCYQCHGTSGQGAAARFGPKIAPDPFPFVAFQQQLRNPRNAMPIYTSKVLSDQQTADIYAYLRSIPQAKPLKDIPLLNDRQSVRPTSSVGSAGPE